MGTEMKPLEVPGLPLNLDECIKLALELRDRANIQELVFMKYLIMLEEQEELWHSQADSSGTYVSFLARFCICDPGRYTVGRKAVERFEEQRLCRLGMDNARIVIRRCPTPELQEQAAVRIEASTERAGVIPSARTTAQLCDNILREAGHMKSRPVVSKLDELQEELRAAKQRIADLEAENTELRERLGNAPPPGSARKSTNDTGSASRGSGSKGRKAA